MRRRRCERSRPAAIRQVMATAAWPRTGNCRHLPSVWADVRPFRVHGRCGLWPWRCDLGDVAAAILQVRAAATASPGSRSATYRRRCA